jgi:molybdenum-dependent DNA-binding transcriptional regulator ModE
MKIICPNCGKVVTINKFGRHRLNLDGIKVLASLRTNGSVATTAKVYGVSRGSIRNYLKTIGVTVKEVLGK